AIAEERDDLPVFESEVRIEERTQLAHEVRGLGRRGGEVPEGASAPLEERIDEAMVGLEARERRVDAVPGEAREDAAILALVVAVQRRAEAHPLARHSL